MRSEKNSIVQKLLFMVYFFFLLGELLFEVELDVQSIGLQSIGLCATNMKKSNHLYAVIEHSFVPSTLKTLSKMRIHTVASALAPFIIVYFFFFVCYSLRWA